MNIIGIFGGTFDPVHQGHISLAEQAQKCLALDRIQFLPCAMPVHRGQPVADGGDRSRMLELAIAGRSNWQVNTVELDREGPSYMVDSLRMIRDMQCSDRLVLLLGVDAFNVFHEWKSPEEILNLTHIAVCHRPGSVPDRNIFRSRQINDADLLRSSSAGRILFLNIDESHCSSTCVRQSLSQGESTSGCLSQAVSQYIQQHQLYEVKSE